MNGKASVSDMRAGAVVSGHSVLAATIGNALEWFDIIVYAIFAPAIAKTFFPSDDPGTSLLVALATFGVSFMVRPIGGVVLGAYADRAGRKAALLAGMLLMMIGTSFMALTPAAASIGVAAPILIVVARMLQGFSAGGEFASATTFLAEQSPERRAYYSSWQFASQGLAIALAAGMGIGISLLLSSAEVDAWGWRIPFLFGMLIGPVALYIRRNVHETAEFDGESDVNPFTDTLQTQRASLVISLGLIVICTIGIYVMLFLPTFAQTTLHLEAMAGYSATAVGGLVLFVATPFFGHIADRRGYINVAAAASVPLILLPVPIFALLIAHPSTSLLILAQCVIALPLSAYFGTVGALVTAMFPTRNRTTGVSLSYNVSVMTFGGMAPAVMAWLIARTGWAGVPSFYLSFGAVVSLLALLAARTRSFHYAIGGVHGASPIASRRVETSLDDEAANLHMEFDGR